MTHFGDALGDRAAVGAHRIGPVRAAAARADRVAGGGDGGGRARVQRRAAAARSAARRLYRPVDHARGFPLGILLYPLSVLLLTLAFPSRLDIAAAAWGILAFGDGFATLVGRSRTKKRGTANTQRKSLCELSELRGSIGRLPWNPDKSIAGTLAFIVFGGARRRRARVVGAAGGRRRCRR